MCMQLEGEYMVDPFKFIVDRLNDIQVSALAMDAGTVVYTIPEMIELIDNLRGVYADKQKGREDL